ncbi:MAG: DMT family transporter, partial [Rhodovibrionaceae bacterium]
MPRLPRPETDSPAAPAKRGIPRAVQGPLYMVAAALGFSIMNLLIREASSELEPLQIAFFRNFFAVLAMAPWLLRAGLRRSFATRHFKLHVARATIGFVAMVCWFYSIALLPLAEATALNFTVPLFATVGAALILGEVVRARRWTATIVGFLGVLIILQPGFKGVETIMLLPVVAAFFMAGVTLLIKRLSDTDAPMTIVLYMNVLLTGVSAIPALLVWHWPSPGTWLILLLLGAVGAISQIWVVRAYQRADASAILPFDYARLPFIALLAFLFFGEIPDIWTWIGGAVIA